MTSQDFLQKIKTFYEAGYNQFRAASFNSLVVIHDAFQDRGYWQGFMGPRTTFSHVMLDTHQYHIFTDAQVALNPTQHIASVCAFGTGLSSMDKWTVVGEWTGAQTEYVRFPSVLNHLPLTIFSAAPNGSTDSVSVPGTMAQSTAVLGTVAAMENTSAAWPGSPPTTSITSDA